MLKAKHDAAAGGLPSGGWHAHVRSRIPGHTSHRVALLGHELGAVTSVSDDDRTDLLRRALVAVSEPAEHAKILAAMAREAYHIDAARPLGDPRQLADDAVVLARGTGDAGALAFCLLAKHDTEWRAGTAADRLRLLDEIIDLAPTTIAVLARYVAYLELGDRRAEREFDRFVHVAAHDGGARAQYLSCSRRAMRALMTGDLGNAANLIDEAAAVAKRYGESDGIVVALNQQFELHSERGDRAALLPVLERAREYSSHAAIVASLALARIDAGDNVGAEAAITPYAAVDLDLVKPEYGRVWVLSMLGEAFARLGLVEPVERIAQALLPFAGTNIVVGGGVVFHGAVDHHIGTLLASVGNTGAAAPHLQDAFAMHERLGALPWIARTAEALGERDRAREIRAGRALAPVASMTFDGTVWTVTFDGTTVTLKDAKGLHDLARLVRSPGSDIGAAELAGAAAEARLGADAAGDAPASTRVHRERDALVEELTAASGLGGRARRLGDPSERARKAVSARIRDAIRTLDERHPTLAAHFRDAVETGTQCRYRPAQAMAWEVRQIPSGG